jgi:hypothetical protein
VSELTTPADVVSVAQRRAPSVGRIEDFDKLCEHTAALKVLGVLRRHLDAFTRQGPRNRQPPIGQAHKSFTGVSKIVDPNLELFSVEDVLEAEFTHDIP